MNDIEPTHAWALIFHLTKFYVNIILFGRKGFGRGI